MRTEFSKFASGRTTVAVSFDPVNKFRLPILAFCPTEGFQTCEPGLRGTEKRYRDFLTQEQRMPSGSTKVDLSLTRPDFTVPVSLFR